MKKDMMPARFAVAACAAVALAAAAVPAGFASGQEQTVSSGWNDVQNLEDGSYYHWYIASKVTVTDGVVTDVRVSAKGPNGSAGAPGRHQPYYDAQHLDMESLLIEAALPADNPDAVDAVDVVSGATHTSNTIKLATKEALVKWNQNNASAREVEAAIAGIEGSNDKIAATKEARAAYNALSTEVKGYVSAEALEALRAAESTYKEAVAQKITVKTTAKSFKASALKKKAQSFSIGAKAKSSASCKVTKADPKKKISVSSAGKVTVKKGTKKGTYKMTVTCTAKASAGYLKATKKVTVKVTVR